MLNKSCKDYNKSTHIFMADIINVVALVKIHPEKIPDGEVLVKTLAEESRKEEGVARYDIFKVVEKPGVYVFLEQYKTLEAVTAHKTSAHFLHAIETAKNQEIFTEPPTIVTLEKEPI